MKHPVASYAMRLKGEGDMVYSGDCNSSGALADFALGCGQMLCDIGTPRRLWTPDSPHRHAAQAAQAARSAGASLIMTHFMPGMAQAAATYYIMSLILFVIMRFVCTAMMKYVKAYKLLIGLALLAVMCCLGAMFGKGSFGVYCLMGISGCMSLMFPTIYGFGLTGLGNDTKIGGSFMVMAIAGAAVLTQIQGIVSDQTGSIMAAYVVPAIAFAVIAYYGFFIARKQESGDCM